jgi:hypothetical protein
MTTEFQSDFRSSSGKTKPTSGANILCETTDGEQLHVGWDQLKESIQILLIGATGNLSKLKILFWQIAFTSYYELGVDCKLVISL